MIVSILLLVAGIALLYFGGEVLVDNSIRIAAHFGVSALVIGPTVVAFATSAPELAATLTAAFKGVPDIAIGNVLGSNVANLALILATAAIVMPLTTTKQFIRRELAFMVFVTVLAYPVMATGLEIGRAEGFMLFVILLMFIAALLRNPGEAGEAQKTDDVEPRPLGLSVLGVVLGIGLLVGGAQALVSGATQITLSLGVAERIIGFTAVAIGTSLPELAASIVAARKNEGDLVMGNIVGSNIFNILCILGITPMVHPIAVAPEALRLDFWMMLGISVLVAAMLAVNRRLERWEGIFLLTIYVGYTVFLLMQ